MSVASIARKPVPAVHDVYALSLATTSKLKMRATAFLAMGDPDSVFDACVLLHEAARGERRAVEALPLVPPATRLAASIEECWCLVEGRDPQRAADAWGRVLREKEHVDGPTADAMLARIRSFFEEKRGQFAKIVAGCTHLARLRVTNTFVPATPQERKAALREVKQVLAAFPGLIGFWWWCYRLSEAMGDMKGAWDALTRARLLDPENRRFEAMSLLVAVHALSAQDADAHLDRARGALGGAGPAVCLMYALAELELAKKEAAPRDRWHRAHQAVQAGLSCSPPTWLYRNLIATRLLLEALLAGKEPTLDIFYQAELGESAAMASPRQDVTELLIALGSSQVAANDAQPRAA